MRPRFQADADFNQKIVAGLRRRESIIDFMSAWDGHVIGKPDPEVLRIASEATRILVSHDRNTMPGHFAKFIEGQSSPGVIIISQELDIGAAIEDLLLVWATTDAARVGESDRLSADLANRREANYPKNGSCDAAR